MEVKQGKGSFADVDADPRFWVKKLRSEGGEIGFVPNEHHCLQEVEGLEFRQSGGRGHSTGQERGDERWLGSCSADESVGGLACTQDWATED